MSAPKKHHYIPKFLLNNFINKDGMLYFLTKKNRSTSISKSKPENLFVQKHLYSKSNFDGTKDISLEQKYASLESEVSELIIKILDSIRRTGKPPALSEYEHELWVVFFYNQWKRVPDMHQKYFTEEKIIEALRNTEAAIENPQEYKEFEKILNSNTQQKKDIFQIMKVSAIEYSSGKVENFFKNFGIGILYIKKNNKSFLIGSNAIVSIKYNPNKLFAFDSLLWLPIAHDIAICPTKIIFKGCIAREATDHEIRLINQNIFNASSIVASKSKKLIESFYNTNSTK